MIKKERILIWWAVALILLIPCLDAGAMIDKESPSVVLCYPLVVEAVLWLFRMPAPLTLSFVSMLFGGSFVAIVLTNVVFYGILIAVSVVLLRAFSKGKTLQNLVLIANGVVALCLLVTLVDTVFYMISYSLTPFLAFGFLGYFLFYIVAYVALLITTAVCHSKAE